MWNHAIFPVHRTNIHICGYKEARKCRSHNIVSLELKKVRSQYLKQTNPYIVDLLTKPFTCFLFAIHLKKIVVKWFYKINKGSQNICNYHLVIILFCGILNMNREKEQDDCKKVMSKQYFCFSQGYLLLSISNINLKTDFP